MRELGVINSGVSNSTTLNLSGCKTRGVLANETKSLNNDTSETDLEVFSNSSEMVLINSGEHEELLTLTQTGDY